ncbi:uncharacterized protein LOC126819677 isoform X2 [Patella vulgata]|nr:uncharacterized protein LOC126819677 isoform X2 [Patella vulgata]XP_050403806.2 uncharacterized protein LOC126819677 isoform X2 [Patella vulgata]
MTLLKDNLAANGTIRPYIVTDNDDWTCLRNSTNNCLITSQKKLQDIDLSDVECLFEYESSNESILKAICENQETNFIGFTIQNFHNIPPINDMTKTKQDPDNIRDVYKHFQPITVIGSTSLTQHEDILHILESKYNISVIERDYSVIQELKSTSFADIVLDQNQAILLKDLLHLTEESNIELVTRQLASFALKYKKCWIILFMFDNTKGYPLSSQVLSNLFKLEAALANMSRKGQQDVAFKVLLCHQKEDICCIVREICDMVCQSTLHENLERPWLAQTMSKEEKMLLCIPCLNSFSSQLLLKKASLKEIITMSLEDLHHLFPEIPYKVLEAFYKVFNNDNGLQLQPTPSSQQLSESDEYHIIHNGLESPDMYSEPQLKNRDEQNGSRFTSMHNTDNTQKRINNCDSPPKLNYRENVYSGQLISKRSFSEDFLVDLTSESQNSSVSDSQDMSDNPNQYVVAELEGREFYNKLADNNSKSSEWLNTKSDMYTVQCNIPISEKNCKLKKFHYLKNDTQSKYATTYASYSEPELRNLDRELDKNIHTHDIGFNKYQSEESSSYTKIPHSFQERQISSRKQPYFPHLSQAWSNLSDYHSAINTYRQTSQRSPEKAFPSKTCIPIESNQTVKRLQERNAIDISGISIRDKIQVYENNDNRQFDDSVSPSLKSQRNSARQSCCFSPNASSSRKIARFSADLTSTTRNLLRRPVLHETLQNNLLHPSVQRVSVGLAQPLRRVTENQETSNDTKNLLLNGKQNDTINSNQRKRTDVPFLNNRKDTIMDKPNNHGNMSLFSSNRTDIHLPYNRDMQGPNDKDDLYSAIHQRNISNKSYVTDYSPPMDLACFSPTTEDQMSRMFSEQNYSHRSRTNIPTVDETRVHHVSGENSMSNIKRSKLSYKPIPGRKGGQTVLSFN